MAYFDKISVNGTQRDIRDAGAVRFDEAQSLTTGQQNVARENMRVPATDAVAHPYDLLTYPVSAGTYCIHEGLLYKALVDIPTAETWTSAHWQYQEAGLELQSLAGRMGTAETDITALQSGKVAVAQGSGNAGKALVVGEDGNVTLGEAGVPEEVATALLSLLQHVAYADDQGGAYYAALRAALAGETYPCIRAVFAQGSTIIYADDPLTALKPMLTVMYYETASSAGTAVTDYTLSGTLADGACPITVTYNNLTTVFIAQIVDWMNHWVWTKSSGLLAIERAAGTRDASGEIWCNVNNAGANAQRRRMYFAYRGVKPAIEYTTRQSLGVYPIHVPARANRITIKSSDPTDEIGFESYLYENSIYNAGSPCYINWAVSGADGHSKDFTPVGNAYGYMLARRPNNADFASDDVPSEVTITFEEV